MKRLLLAAVILTQAALARADKWGVEPGLTKQEEDAFSAPAQMFQEAGRDKLATVQSFESYLQRFSGSPRAADAEFMVGEAYLEHALSILKAEATQKKTSTARLLAPKNPAALQALENARKAFTQVASDKKSGLAPSAQYRLAEVAYNEKDWNRAAEEFREVEKRFPKSYIVPEALMGIVFADLALEQFSQAEANIFLLGETYPTFLKEPAVKYAQGIIALHKGDYSNAERTLKEVKTAEAQYYLGKTYLLSKRAYLAAAAFENLIRDYPESDLKEEAQFFIGDSFFLAEDFEGAISKYQKFIALYPESPLRVSAMFRIGSSYFQKKDFVEARANFQAVLDRYPKDFFAPLAQYFIAESHLVSNQTREALFAYTKVITQYPETTKISPLAHYKLSWSAYLVGDYSQAIQTANNFLSLYPTNALAKNVYLILGNSLISLKRYVEATSAFQRIIDLAPSSDIAEQALFSILQNQFQQKAHNSILTSYQFIFRHLPPSKSKWRSLSYLYAAEAYLALNQVDEAKVIYEMILKVYPDEPAAFYAQDGLAWAYSYKGEDQRALEERQKLKDMLSATQSTFTFGGLNELGIADSMYNQKSYEDAVKLYTDFAKDNPKSPEAPAALYRAGMSLYHLRYYTDAVDAWRKLISGYPNAKETSMASYQVADTLFRAQKYQESVAAYRQIIETYPNSPQIPMAHLRIAQAQFNAKDDQTALKQIADLIKKFPKVPEATDALDLLEGIFDRNRAINFKDSLSAIVAQNPLTGVSGEAQFRLARRCYDFKDYKCAAAEFQKFSVEYTNHPDLAKAQFFLGQSYFSQNNHAEAIPAFERLIKNFDKSDTTALALFNLAGSHYALKQHEEAVRYYTRLIEEYPTTEFIKAAQFNLALSYKALGKLDLAQYAYQKYAQSVEPGDQSGQSAMWEIFAIQKDRKDYDGALNTLQKIQEASKSDSSVGIEAGYRMAEIYQAMSRPDEAMNTWENIRTMRPLNSPFRLQSLIQLGQAYEKVNDIDRALAVYEDLSRNASKEIAQSASARASGLRRLRGGGAKTAAEPAEPGERAPAPKPSPKKKTAAADKPAAAAPTKAVAGDKKTPSLPGMPSPEEIQ
jgi:TolA-binding protein